MPLSSFAMRRLCPLFFIFSSSLSAAPLTLDEIYHRALTHSEAFARIKLDAQRQELSIVEAETLTRSRVRMQGGLDYVATKADGRSWRDDPLPQLQTEWRYPLLDGGASRSVIEGARLLRDAAQWDVADQKEQLYLQCAQLFYDTLGIEKDLRNLRESESIYLDRVSTLGQREKIGRSRTAEVLAARTQLQVIRSQINDATKRLHLSQERLAFLANSPAPLQLRDDLSLDQIQRTSAELPSRTLPLPSVEAAKARVAAAEKRIIQERSAAEPKLDFVAAHRFSYPEERVTNSLSFGIGLNWQIYDAGQIEASVSGYALEKQKAALAEELSRREELLNQSLNKREWIDGMAQLRDLDLALKSAQQNVKVQQQEFENGQLTNLEVMQALDTRLQVQRSIDQTIYRTKYIYLEARLRAGLVPLASEGMPQVRTHPSPTPPPAVKPGSQEAS